jgi:hypothetical protein
MPESGEAEAVRKDYDFWGDADLWRQPMSLCAVEGLGQHCGSFCACFQARPQQVLALQCLHQPFQ